VQSEGHFFSGRYKALIVDGSGNGYLRTVCDYVHLNAARAKLLPAEAPIESFRWSSYGAYLAEPGARPVWQRVDRLLGEHGIQVDSAAGRREFAKRMELRRSEEARTDYRSVRRGWYLGSEQFAKELIAAAVGRVGPSHYSERRREAEQEKAERIVREELKRAGWQESDLPTQPKGARPKVAAALRLRKETTLTLRWIADRLEMGSWTYVSNLLSAERTARRPTLCQ
jgi:REP-associated tyrosine transposase